jgi:chitodextrinase
MASVDNIGVSGYKVYGNNKLILQTSDTHVELEGLKVFSPYAMDIRAMDEAGNVSEKSEIVNVRTLDLHAPLAPENLKTFEVTDSSLLLSWSPSLDNVGILSYDVFLNGSFLSTHPDTSILIQQLGASRTYSFKVVARDSAENLSSASLPVQVITPDTRAPQKPGGLEAYGTGFRSFVLKWPHSADNVGVTQYRVFQDDVQIAALKENFLFVEGLTVNTTYKMSVAACDAAGNISDTSDCLEVTTVYPGEENAVTAFPNPVSDHILYMDLGTDTFNQGIIEWFNDQGHRIFKMIATPNNRMPSLDLSEYQLYNGMYVLRVKIDGRIFEQKILINRP